MIYYSYFPKDFTKNVMGMMTNEYDLVSKKFRFDINIAKFLIIYHNRSYGILNRF